MALGNLVDLYNLKGMYAEAIAAEKARLARKSKPKLETLERGYAAGGYRGAWKAAVADRTARSTTTYIWSSAIAVMCIRAGEKDLAMDWLERGFEMRDSYMPYVGVMPGFDSLRDEPRFQELLRRMNLPQ